MKTRYICLALLACLSTSASAQRVMKVEKVNGTVIEVSTDSVRRVYFEEPDAAVEAGFCPDSHHPHQIDMGTAGIWSCCNVGASVPWDAGGYYAWGEKAEKSEYNWDTYIHCDGSKGTCHDIGTDISGTPYDAATANWGAPWRMPTFAECKALVNCFSEWMTLNGVKGRKFMGSSGNSIFLPAAGHRSQGDTLSAGSGRFWSSTLAESSSYYAHNLYFYSLRAYWDSVFYRDEGCSVRPVRSVEEPDAAVQAGLCPDNRHPHMIDLGIEGVKWSCCNIGASAPWEYGSYYAWGETEEKSKYDWSTYVYCDGSYDTCHGIGTDISGTLYDAATAKWGAPWRMPTLAECKALRDCSFDWTTLNDVSGCKFTGSNGNSIFLPAAGCFWGGDPSYAGDWGLYWSSTLDNSISYDASYLDINSNNVYWHVNGRDYGQSVRPVR